VRCVESGRLSLDDRVGQFKASSPDAGLTLRQLLTHTTGPSDNPSYSFHPEKLDVLTTIIRSCTGDSFRETLANLLDQMGMADSVPGPDVLSVVPPAEGVLTSEFDRYSAILKRLAVPYAVDAQRRATRSAYSGTKLTPTSGLITTVRDFAKFDVGMKNGLLVRPETLAGAWSAGSPHGAGWFVQNYNGLNVVWQFGNGDTSSSLVVTVPGRSVTMVLLANSSGLSKGFGLSGGDVLSSPFARAFLGLFAI